MEGNINKFKNQNIVLEDRSKMSVSGVEQVDSFNENIISLSTIKGGMNIKGSDLNISNLNLEDGKVKISGLINSIEYISKEGEPKGILGKIFR